MTERLSLDGHEVIALDAILPDLYPFSRKKRNWDNLGLLKNTPKRLLLDLRNPVDPREIEGCEFIFHLAAMPGLSLSWKDTKLYIDCNVLGTSNLLKACNLSQLRNFFYISTSSVYGKSIDGDENTPLSPISPYGVSKLAAEKLVSAYSAATGMPFSIIRPFSVYGPRQREDMAFNIFIRKMLREEEITIFGDGSQSRTNTFVSDLVEGLVSGIENAVCGEVYNISGNQEYSVLDVLTILEELIGKSPKLVFSRERLGDQKNTRTESLKARIDLQYLPATTLKEGLSQQIDWQKANP